MTIDKEKLKRIAKYVVGALLLTVIAHQVITYTVPSKLEAFNVHEYQIQNPYKEHPLDENDVEKLAMYLKNNRFRRVTPPRGGYDGNETVFFLLLTKDGHFIQVIYTLYYPPFSCVQYDDKWYGLDKKDRAFLHNLIFNDTEE